MKKKTKSRRTSRKTVSDQLRAVIRERELSTYWIGKTTGLNPSVIGRFLHGAMLRSDSLDKICQALDLGLKPRDPGEK